MTDKTESPSLQREQGILEEIIRYYMETQEAISARTLSKISTLSLSPTTIRNLMEDLSDAGLLTAEGVTRGRIPTQKAFTLYVTRLRPKRPQSSATLPKVEAMDETGQLSLADVVFQRGDFLARKTGLLVMALLPGKDFFPLRWMRFNTVPEHQVLVVVKTLFGDLWSKTLQSTKPFPEELLFEISRLIGDRYQGQSLAAIRNEIMSGEPKDILENMPSLGAAFRMLRRAFEWGEQDTLLHWGRKNLLQLREYQDPQNLRHLFTILEDSEVLGGILKHAHPLAGGLVVIGTDTGYPGLEQSAVLAFPFSWQDWRGWMAVLGPMHMNYRQVAEYTTEVAHSLSVYLSHCAHHPSRS